MGQILFKKHSKIQNYDEIFYRGRTRLRRTSLGGFILSIHKNHLKKQKYETGSDCETFKIFKSR